MFCFLTYHTSSERGIYLAPCRFHYVYKRIRCAQKFWCNQPHTKDTRPANTTLGTYFIKFRLHVTMPVCMALFDLVHFVSNKVPFDHFFSKQIDLLFACIRNTYCSVMHSRL